jgi:hypothetical protein
MNEVQLKLCQDMPEYFAATIYFQNETDGGWDEIKGMTYQEVEAYVENLDAEGVNALFVKLVQKQGESSWSLETPNEGDIATTSGTKDKNAENNKGTAEFISDPSEGELVLVDHEYNGKETVAVMHLPNGGTINVRVNITKDGAIFDGKGLVSEFQITPPPDGAPGCNNPEAGKGKPTPDKPTPDKPTPDKPTPDDPTPDKPTPDKPTPDDPTPDKPTPTPTPEGKTPLAVKEGNEQEGTSGTGLTEKPVETETVNPDTNAGASAAPENVGQAPDSSSQAGAGMNSETTKSQDGGTVAEKVNDGDKSGGENGENTAAQKNTEPQTEAKKKQQEEDDKGKAAEASSSSSNKKKPNKSAEQKSAENQAEEDKNDADLYKDGYFAI